MLVHPLLGSYQSINQQRCLKTVEVIQFKKPSCQIRMQRQYLTFSWHYNINFSCLCPILLYVSTLSFRTFVIFSPRCHIQIIYQRDISFEVWVSLSTTLRHLHVFFLISTHTVRVSAYQHISPRPVMDIKLDWIKSLSRAI